MDNKVYKNYSKTKPALKKIIILIIHEGKAKEITTDTVVLYVIKKSSSST
jgi:hypothetical protein